MPTPSENSTLPMEIDQALARSVVYGVLAVALGRPDAQKFRRAFSGERARIVIEAARKADRSGQLAVRMERLVSAAASVGRIQPDHERLFGHTARGELSSYETEYGKGGVFRQSHELSDINGFYHAFGLTLPESRHERNDHVSVECEFLSFLSGKEAHHLISGDVDEAAAVRRARRLFLRDHLGQFGRAFANTLATVARDRFYRSTAGLFLEFLTGECADVGVDPGPKYLPLRSTEEEDVPMACGSSCPEVDGAGPCGEGGSGALPMEV